MALSVAVDGVLADVVLGQLAEQVAQRGRPGGRLEAVLLLDGHPGQLAPAPRQLVAAAGVLLLGLEQLETHYENIQKVNDGILERIRGVVLNDADVNALIIIQGFADLLTITIAKDLSKIEPLFFRSEEA